jgi:hypothetical protein
MTAGSLIFGDGFFAQGQVDLRRARVIGELRDTSSPVPAKNIHLEGLTYGSLAEGSEQDKEILKGRLEWLKGVDYAPQVYRQLAAVYAAEGEESSAKKVLIAGREARRKNRHWFQRGFEWILKITVRYGYSPLLVLAPLAVLELAGWLCFHLLIDDMVVVPIYKDDSVSSVGHVLPGYPDFRPAVYTLDLLLPVVDLGQSKFWFPVHAAEWWSIFFTVAGWTLVTALVVGLGSVFRSDDRNEGHRSQ